MKSAHKTAAPLKDAQPAQKPGAKAKPRKPSGPFSVIEGDKRDEVQANHRRAGPLPPSPGEQLPTPLQARLGPLTGAHAAGEARVHIDDTAAAIAHAHKAHAVTIGADIYFAKDRYRPGTATGDALIGHEVAHVEQAQRGLFHGPAAKGMDGDAHNALEASANRTGDHLAPGADIDKHKRPNAPDAKAKAQSKAKDGKAPPAKKGADAKSAEAKTADTKAADAKAGPAGPEAAEAQAPEAAAAKSQTVPLIPEPAMELSTSEDKRVSSVENRGADSATAQSTAPAATENVADAQAAVAVPQAEANARAAQDLVAGLAQLPPPSPEIVALCERIKRLIKDKRPADEEGVIDTRPDEVARNAGGTVEGDVNKNVDDAKASYASMDATPQGATPPTPGGIAPQPDAAETKPVNAPAAVPDAVPAEQTSLDGDSTEMDRRSKDAGLQSEPAKLVESGPIADARGAQGDMDSLGKEAPEEALKQQKAALAQANNDMRALQAKAAAALKSARAQHVDSVESQQELLKGGEEGIRTKLAADADAIFSAAQTQVNDLLGPVHDVAMKKWSTELPLISGRFNDDLKVVKNKIDERHSGVGGWFVAGWDAVTGLPAWVEEAYDRAERNFGNDICTLVTGISQDVNFVIDQAKKIIEKARDDIHGLFTQNLPDSLKTWAAEQEKGFGKKLDALQASAEKTRRDFDKELVENAGSAVQSAREQIQKLRSDAHGVWGRFLDAVNKFLDDPVKFLIDGLLTILGIAPPAFWSTIAKIQRVAKDIADDPVSFCGNLLSGIGRGFSQFFDRIAKHLAEGLIEWLLSGLKEEGITIEIPKEFSLKAVVSFFLSLLGISWTRIRKLLVEQLGEKPVAYMEKAAGVIYTLATKGLAGVYEEIQAMLDPKTIVNTIVDTAIRFITVTLVEQVAKRIVLMFNPAGAILAALEAIYRVLKWIFTNAARIFHLIEAVVNGMADVIAGNIGGVANTVEKALAMLVAPVIGFLADYIGLGGLPGKVAKAVMGLQAWVEGVMRRIIAWLVEMGKKLLAALGFKVGDDKDKKKGDEGVGERVGFSGGGESHTLYIAVSGSSATVMVSSAPQTLAEWLDGLEKKIPDLTDDKQKEATGLIGQARGLMSKTDTEADRVAAAHAAAAASTAPAPAAPAADPGNEAVKTDEQQLADVLGKIATIFGVDNFVQTPKKLDAGAVNVSRPKDNDDLVRSLGDTATSTVYSGPALDDKTGVLKLVNSYGARFDPKSKKLELSSADAGSLAAQKSVAGMGAALAKATGVTTASFEKTGERYALKGSVFGLPAVRLAYGDVPGALEDAEVEKIAKDRHDQLLGKWTDDVTGSGFKALISGKEEEVWHGFAFDRAGVTGTGLAALKARVQEKRIDTVTQLREAMTTAAVRTLFQTDGGNIAAAQAKQKGLARVTDDDIRKKIEAKVKYSPNDQLGRIDTPAGDSDHSEFMPLDITETANGDSVVTTYRTKGGQTFTVTRDAKSLLISSVEGKGLSLKAPGGPQGRGVTQDSPAFEPGTSMNRSHLIADEFKGSGYADGLNLISASDHYNKIVMRGAEIKMGQWLADEGALTFEMKVDVTWSEVVDPKIIAAIETADWYPKAYVQDANLHNAIVARLAQTPKLKRCASVTYTATITDAIPPKKPGASNVIAIGTDIWLLLNKK